MESETTVDPSPSSHAKAIEKLKRVILEVAETHPNRGLTPSAKALFLNRLDHFFSLHKTPNHPPYSAMIERAIKELNEKGGSSEDSISKFLQMEYKDALPLHHSIFLNHHLTLLSQSHHIHILPSLPNKYTILHP